MTLTLVWMWVLVLFPSDRIDKTDTVAMRAFPLYADCREAAVALSKGVNPGGGPARLECLFEETWVSK